jgi:hypothetical protein
VVAALGQPAAPAERERLMQWRDRRLLALRRHKIDNDTTDNH